MSSSKEWHGLRQASAPVEHFAWGRFFATLELGFNFNRKISHSYVDAGRKMIQGLQNTGEGYSSLTRLGRKGSNKSQWVSLTKNEIYQRVHFFFFFFPCLKTRLYTLETLLAIDILLECLQHDFSQIFRFIATIQCKFQNSFNRTISGHISLWKIINLHEKFPK